MSSAGRRRRLRAGAPAGAVGAALALAGCGQEGAPSVLDPRGPAAAEIAWLWWVLLGLATVVGVITFGFLAVAVLRRSRRRGRGRDLASDATFVTVWGIAVPGLVLGALMVLTVRVGTAVYDAPTEPDVVIDVYGHQFWWEVRYADAGVVTANEVHIPVGEPVGLRLHSRDVMHNFWVPQLHGKMYMIPGRTNEFWLQADEPGVYEGFCGEYCGIQHARMRKRVIAMPRDEFDRWLVAQAEDAAVPTDGLAAEGREVFLASSCVQCHQVRGETPPNDIGPDLTHLASRRTLAAGLLENNRGNLGGWIVDPQALKPGNRMPPSQLTGPELQALLAYLESLE